MQKNKERRKIKKIKENVHTKQITTIIQQDCGTVTMTTTTATETATATMTITTTKTIRFIYIQLNPFNGSMRHSFICISQRPNEMRKIQHFQLKLLLI